MKKIILLLILGLNLLGLVGCEKSEQSEVIELTISTWDATRDSEGKLLIQKAIDEYTNENENIHIVLNVIGNEDTYEYMVELGRSLMTETASDIVAFPSASTCYKWARDGYIKSLDELIKDEGVTYSELYTFDFRVENSYYAIPQYGDQIYGVYINKDLLNDAGLPVPTKGWTWEEYAEYAGALTKETNEGKTWGSHISFLDKNYLKLGLYSVLKNNPYIDKEGNLNLEEEILSEWLLFLEQLQENGFNMSYKEMYECSETYKDLFLKGKVAMLPASESILYNIADLQNYPREFEVVFVPLPVWSKECGNITQKSASYYYSLSGNIDDKKAKAAYDFIRWYSGKGAQVVGNIPADRTRDVEAAQRTCFKEMGLLEAGFDIESFINVYLYSDLRTNEYVAEPELFSDVDKLYVEQAKLFLQEKQSLDKTMEKLKEEASLRWGTEEK